MADPRHDLGLHGEDAAARWLVARGWTLLDRRWRCDAGELDLVLLDPDGVLVAVEVKLRRGGRSGTAAEAIDARRLARLRAALARFASERRVVAAGLRVDLVSVEPAGERRWRLRRLPGIDAW
jgi:putative endonuclease